MNVLKTLGLVRVYQTVVSENSLFQEVKILNTQGSLAHREVIVYSFLHFPNFPRQEFPSKINIVRVEASFRASSSRRIRV
jgi:hypothetical protein